MISLINVFFPGLIILLLTSMIALQLLILVKSIFIVTMIVAIPFAFINIWCD
jgi:hypothetical protein